ncbi:putative Ig domain-containing protein [Dactylosporangium sp. CS-047395]|uniref:putative Ig domain-containing protein n=1 Tax=Dactylosporangium sp. CS-047395 TaxID=3239936 RepID=UPI003D8CFEC6
MQRPPRDEGFSLVETLTALAIMGVVMTALTTFFVSTTNTINKQRGLQMAIRLASDGIELVKSLPSTSLAIGRSKTDALKQLAGTPAGLDLTSMAPVFDPKLKNLTDVSSATPVLKFSEVVPINDAVFTRRWILGSCAMNPTVLTGASCVLPTLLSIANPLPYYRVIVAITWQNSRACAGGECSYVTDTLVAANTTDPVFNPSATAPKPLPDNPGNQTGEVGVPISPVTLTASSSYQPITWSGDQLPPGITISDAGVISGTPTAAGLYVVTVTVKDQISTNDASFNWIVVPQPTLPVPDQTWDAGAAVSYQVPVVGGTAPYTWSAATGLPTGLNFNATTGVITGSSSVDGAAAASRVTVNVTDKFGQTATKTFTWNTRVAVRYPNSTTPIALVQGDAYTGDVQAWGGTKPYTFSVTNMPTGLSISPAGRVTGTLTSGTRYLVTLTVTDANRVSNSTLVPVNVTVKTGLRVTTPSLTAPDKSSPKGTQLTFNPAATGGTGTLAWTAAGLPPGLTLAAGTGAITGTPSTPGTYTVTLTVTDSATPTKATSTFAFTWTIT